MKPLRPIAFMAISRTCIFLGHCYLFRGITHYESGNSSLSALDLSKALSHIDIKQSKRIYYAAVHNLAVALTSCSAEALDSALLRLKKARRRIRFRGRHMAKFKLRWLEGKICIRFGSTRQGERYLWAAREGLEECRAPYEMALVSIEIGELWLREGRAAADIYMLALETYRIFEGLSADEEALAALILWRDTAHREALTHKLLRSVHQTITRCTVPAE